VTVEDRGYVDMERMDLLHESGRFFVIRLRKNMERRAWKSLRRLQTIDSPVLEDGTCFIGKAKNRFRVVSFRDAKGRTIHVVTNLMHVSAEVIAELYKARWQVELFFRWIKQHLNVKRLFGTTPNAVYGQLFGACIAYVLLHWLYTREKSRRFQDVSLLQFARQLWLSQLPAEWVLCLFDHLHRLGARTCYLC
jgi:IS4 transposase